MVGYCMFGLSVCDDLVGFVVFVMFCVDCLLVRFYRWWFIGCLYTFVGLRRSLICFLLVCYLLDLCWLLCCLMSILGIWFGVICLVSLLFLLFYCGVLVWLYLLICLIRLKVGLWLFSLIANTLFWLGLVIVLLICLLLVFCLLVCLTLWFVLLDYSLVFSCLLQCF